VQTLTIARHVGEALVEKRSILRLREGGLRADLAHEAALVLDECVHLISAAVAAEGSISPNLCAVLVISRRAAAARTHARTRHQLFLKTQRHNDNE
jgi:hypothetical protein